MTTTSSDSLALDARHAPRPAEGTPRPADVAAAKPGRITALDWARGLFLILSVCSEAVLAPRPEQLVHATWSGITAYDLIFPLFVTLSGAGLALAYKNRAPARVTARRVVVLLLAGLAYNAVTTAELTWETFRLTGPLQVYAVLVLVIAVLHRWVHTARGWALTTLLVAAAVAVALAWWATGCATGALTPECNPSLVIDGRLLGSHMYAQGRLGHDPEGLVAIAGTFVTAAAGVTAGHLMVRYRRSPLAPAWLLGWAAVALGAGVLLAQWVEPMKRLWTPSFALLAAGLGVAILAIGFLLHDVPAPAWWAGLRGRLAVLLVALGRNSLLVYFGSHVVHSLLLRSGEPSAAVRIAEAVARDADPRLEFVLLSLAAWWLLALVLHSRRIYVHA
ncbi:heparan-alpha-glucosaminide N-acetyltransferase domain-containing protein [Georgenia sp. SYP-B2076]|uniref:heparan-alpha-glucosaminide N-acetyltransferase domain-containing protein n=1 Tax=Georgenia sp. SYP-B2076 TaxID=2495881 RepID=UPI000F8DE34D|nr:heparan-alpha-glucosaminide N-acetyltransferase domain-containing protein [Georgenia sp. SYP-B2076]